MADKVSRKVRSRMMAAVGSKNTAPELRVRRVLFGAGFHYRLHPKALPGKPDIVLPGLSVAIFVNGCFWHGHECHKGRRPTSNQEFWNRKIDQNRERDLRKTKLLEATGWHVCTVWECELDSSVERLLGCLSSRKKRLGGFKER